MVQSKLFRAFLFALLALMPFTAMAQQSLSVTNDSAGHLTKFIPDSIKYQVTQLQVAGPLNGNDIKLIQEMILRAKTKEKAEPFRQLDLSEAVIVEGKEGMKTRDNEMPDKMFSGCKTLEQVVLPNNIINVSPHAFDGCASLVSVSIPESVTDMGGYAFANCKELADIALPGNLMKIGDYAFSKCEKLQAINIPESVKQLGGHAFEDCKNLVTANINGEISKLENSVFKNCGNLASVSLPECLSAIDNNAFQKCESLNALSLPDGVKTIGSSAFEQLPLVAHYPISTCPASRR